MLMVANGKLRLKDDYFQPLELRMGWYVEEVAGIPVRTKREFRAALATVDRAGGETFEILFSQGFCDGITTSRNYRKLGDEAPYESGRKRRPGQGDKRVSASMFTEIKSGELPEGAGEIAIGGLFP